MRQPPLARSLVAELIGTFALVFAGAGAIMVNEQAAALGHIGMTWRGPDRWLTRGVAGAGSEPATSQRRNRACNKFSRLTAEEYASTRG